MFGTNCAYPHFSPISIPTVWINAPTCFCKLSTDPLINLKFYLCEARKGLEKTFQLMYSNTQLRISEILPLKPLIILTIFRGVWNRRPMSMDTGQYRMLYGVGNNWQSMLPCFLDTRHCEPRDTAKSKDPSHVARMSCLKESYETVH